jgi:hypothetical protein
MAFTNSVSLSEFNGVAAGQTCTLRVPTGYTWHRFLLTYTGITLAQIEGIRLKVNGKTLQNFNSGSFLDMLNKFEGRAAASGAIYIDLERFGLNVREMKQLSGLGTGINYNGPRPATDPIAVTSIYFEIDCAAAASAPVFTCKGTRSGPSPTRQVKKLRNMIRSASGAGDLQIADLPRGEPITKLVIESSVVTAVKLEINGATVFERTAAENNQEQTDGERVPQTNVFVLDPSELGYGDEAIPTGADVNELLLTLTTSGADTAIEIAQETIGFLEV